MLSALAASEAAAQIQAPTPPPVQTFPLNVPAPQYTPPNNQPSTALPQYNGAQPYSETMPPLEPAIPPLRIPQSFSAPYAAPVPTTCTTYPGAHGQFHASCGAPGDCRAGCSSCGGDGCGVCGPQGRIWGEFDYILWSARGDKAPPLVTTSPAGTASASAGVLGTPGAGILAGGAGLGDEFRSGIRVNIGGWLNDSQTFGVQVGGFTIADANTSAAFSSTGDPILARPFVNAITGLPASQLVALPGILAGGVGVDHSSSIYGFDAALRGNMCCSSCYRLDALLGYRYFHLEEGLTVSENLTAGAAAPAALGVAAGTNIRVVDAFSTSNTFNGVQAGFTGEYRFWDRLFFSGTGKASFGWIDQTSNIFGATTVTLPGATPTTAAGGLLALSSNIGSRSRSEAVIVPELNLNLGMQVTQNVRLRAGYNFLYVSSVVRPGNVIDTTVNPGLIPPPTGSPLPARPAVQPRLDDFFLHGINAGVEVRF